MHSIHSTFKAFEQLKILIIGDAMLDCYIWGSATKISPEAPVPVIAATKKNYRLGGAANVALNVQALGATPILCTLIGKDDEGKRIRERMGINGISDEGIIETSENKTTVKTRVIANQQHIVRIDEEDVEPVHTQERALLDIIKQQLPQCHAVIFEDYDKGAITPCIIETTIETARQRNIPIIVDPKKKHFMLYKNATLIKPNLKELTEGLGITIEVTHEKQLICQVAKLKQMLQTNVMATLSEKGIYLDYEHEKIRLPAHQCEIVDVSGAGDTVTSIAALGVASNLPPYLIAALSNLGGSIVCKHVGVIPLEKNELMRESINNKIFEKDI